MNYPGGGPPQGPQGQGNGNMYPCQPGPGNSGQWGGYPPQGGHMNQQPAPPYYPQHQMPAGMYITNKISFKRISALILFILTGVPNGPAGVRFERPMNQSKQALSIMLRARIPTNQYMGMQQQGGVPAHNFQGMPPQQRQFLR